MKSYLRVSICALCAMLMLFAGHSSVTYAADAKGVGKISGGVIDSSGKPVVGLAMKIFRSNPRSFGNGQGSGKKKSTVGQPAATELQTGSPIATVMTDAQGKFVFNSVPEGIYLLVAGSQSVGWIYQDVNVKANEEAKVGDLKLAKAD
ncbi:MAG TPA: carboxypeptidase-like regulatory domain-containing protein [Tepidisphaeraceae bacterium]